MSEIVTLVTNQGFAIAMATYTIVTVNKSMQEMTKAIVILNEKLDKEERLNDSK